MEWRQQTTFSHSDAFIEAQRWIEEVTGKAFVFSDFRASLENGVLLCDLINQLKPGIIKRLNRLSTPIAGLDNVNVFLKACEKFGLNESQLFHPGDLQDLSTRVTLRRDESNRRLKNVLITIYWLGRKAHLDTFYVGPRLNVKAFEGLLGLALSKVCLRPDDNESSNVTMKDDGYSRCPDGEEFCPTKVSYERENSMDSVESLDSRAFQPNSEGCGSDAEAEQVFRMETTQNSVPQTKGRVPALVKSKQGQHITSCSSPFARSKSLSDIPLVSSVWKVSDGNTVLDVDQESATARERNHENKRRAVANDGEAQWHDASHDLTKWKNRRRSTNSDLRRKSQDREHVISQMTNGAVTNEARGGGLQRYVTTTLLLSVLYCEDEDVLVSTVNLGNLSFLHYIASSSHISAETSRPHVLVPLLCQSPQASESAIPASNGDVVGEDVCYASPASNGAGVTTPSADGPFHSLTQVKALGSSAASQHVTELVKTDDVVSDKVSTLVTTKLPHETESSRTREPPFCEDPQVPTRGSHAGDLAPESVPLDSSEQKVRCEEEGQRMSSEPAKAQSCVQQPAGNWKYLSRAASWSSASLPRGFRRSEGSSRLSSVITARPFDTKLPRASSVHGLCSVNDSPDLSLNCETDLSVSPQTATSQLKNGYHHQQTGSKGSGPPGHTLQAYSCTHRSSTQTHRLPQLHSMQSQPRVSSVTSTANVELPQVDHSDLRLSLTLKPSSRVDFGFQTRWESTGLRVQCVQPGSPAELCQLCTNDEVVAVDGVSVAHMSPGQWEEKMTSALQTGSLTMDIRRYGNKAAAGHCSPSRNACSRYSTGALSSQKEKSLHSHVDGYVQPTWREYELCCFLSYFGLWLTALPRDRIIQSDPAQVL
ncbi:unnamed protein product [Lampetra planeri]